MTRFHSDSNDKPLSEQFRLVAKKWVDADAAASLLEETKSAFLAQKIAEQGDMAVNRAENIVKGGHEWKTFITSMVDARKAASLLKVQLEYLRMRHAENQSNEATMRAEMRI